MGLGDVPDQCQPHSAAPAPLRVAPAHAIELLEDLRVLRLRNSEAAVGHGQGQASADGPRVDGEHALRPRVLDRVVDEVRQRLTDRPGVQREFPQVRRDGHVDLEPLLREGVRERVERVADQRLDRGRRHLVRATTTLDPREVEHVVDQPREPLALARDHAVVLAALPLVGHAPHLERLPEHPDHGERSLQIVRDVGDEVRFEPRHFGLPARESPARDDPGHDEHEQDAEGDREEHDLAADRLAGRRAGRLVHGQAPLGQGVSEADRQHVLGVPQWRATVHRPPGRVEHRDDRRRLEGSQRRVEDVAPQRLDVARERGEPYLAARRDEPGQTDLAAGDDLVLPAPVGSALAGLGGQRPERPRVAIPPRARIDALAASIEEVEAADQRRLRQQRVQRALRALLGRQNLLEPVEEGVLGVPQHHLDFLGRHRGHIARLLAEEQV